MGRVGRPGKTGDGKMDAVVSSSRVVGGSITVYDMFDGTNPTPKYVGTITAVTKKFITVKSPFANVYRFHRATGFIVGYAHPVYMFAIASETCG